MKKGLSSGLKLMLLGMAVSGVCTLFFFVACMMALSGGVSSKWPDWTGPLFGMAFLTGLVMMGVGFISAIIQAIRR